jgi:WXG100 family type VII secretion target
MADIMKMNYADVDNMIKTFQQGKETLQDTASELQSIASAFEEAAKGHYSDEMVDGLRSDFAPALNKLIEKFQDMADSVQAAKDLMQAADESESAPLFG